MKIYHKFLLYQNKWIHPYVRMTVGVMTSITYLASHPADCRRGL